MFAQAVPQPIPRAAFSVTMDGEFRKVDANKDGQLTLSEVERFQQAAALAQAQRDSRAAFVALDVDRNGQISSTEWAKLPLTPPRTNSAILMRFDTGRDGKVSLIEHRTATLTNFDRLDTDKDGIVTGAEMKAGGVAR
ncbi:MAG: hypothetical protein M3R03_09890 [Pseudomonadota bacterium]|nr:hypothetical protein [Pseudomonadota bacterium]